MYCPKFSGPALGQGSSFDNVECRIAACGYSRTRGCGVGALIVNQNYLIETWVILGQVRSYGLADIFRLVASWNDGYHIGPRGIFA